MAKVAEVAASGSSTPRQKVVVDLTHSPKKRSKPQSLEAALSGPPPSSYVSKLCLESSGYSEIYHPDLQRILPIVGVDEWGSFVEVDAEEHAGTMHGAPSRVVDWSFLVDVLPEAPNKA